MLCIIHNVQLVNLWIYKNLTNGKKVMDVNLRIQLTKITYERHIKDKPEISIKTIKVSMTS